MAEVYCEACETLRTNIPELITEGIDSTMCTSLGNDTGLKPSLNHNDCTDLNDLNDCLKGNMVAELEKYDPCDWKEYMANYASNDFTITKALICVLCGIWSNIHSLERRVASLENRMTAVEGRVTNLESEVADIWDCLRS